MARSKPQVVRRGFGVVLILLALLIVGCIALPPYRPIEGGDAAYPAEKLGRELDPWLLGEGFGDRIVIEVDWVEGCEPGPRALAPLEEMLRRYVPADRTIEIVRDDEIPLEEWDELSGPYAIDALLGDEAAEWAETPPGTERRLVLFVPSSPTVFGYSKQWVVAQGDSEVVIDGVVVARDGHARYAKLWLDLDRMLGLSLVHEFGHQLGLVENDRHERVDERHRLHCTSLRCAMAHPTPRVVVRNAVPALFNAFPDDYCAKCQNDILRAQGYWREQVAADPGYRAARSREREIDWAEARLRWLLEQGRPVEVLERTGALRTRYPGQLAWHRVEARALSELGRWDEAIVQARLALPTDPADWRYWPHRQTLGRLLVGVGQHEDAAALFDRSALRDVDSRKAVGPAYTLIKALEGTGRFAEAAAVAGEEFLQRGPDGVYWSACRADLLRRAGQVDEAAEILAEVLAGAEERTVWLLDRAAAVHRAEGRSLEARELLEEQLAAVANRSDWTAVRLLAELGRMDEARDLAARLDAEEPPDGPRRRVQDEAPAWIALGELERAAAIVRQLPVDERWFADPCGYEALESLRMAPEHAGLFAHCPDRIPRNPAAVDSTGPRAK